LYKNFRKYFSIEELKNIYNRILEWSYFKSPQKSMDFPTFCVLMNIMKIYQESNYNSQGFLDYFSLYSNGLIIHTYSLIQNFVKLIVKEDTIFKSLNYGLKIDSVISEDYKKLLNSYKIIKDRNKIFSYQKENYKNLNVYSSKISLEHLFLLYRFFELLHFSNIRFPYSFEENLFNKFLECSKIHTPQKEIEVISSFLKNSSDLIEKSYQDFQAICSASGTSNSNRKDYDKYIFNIIDLNNSKYLEIYELMLLNKAASIFEVISEDMVLNKNQEKDTIEDSIFIKKLRDFNIKNIYNIDENEIEYLFQVSYYKK